MANNRFNRDFLEKLAKAAGIQIDIETDGKESLEGYIAQLNDKGELAQFTHRKHGKSSGWTLKLSADPARSRIVRTQTFHFPEDALNDPEEGYEETYAEWIERWLEEIVEDGRAAVRCHFCGLSTKEVQLMISGKTSTFVCDGCIQILHDVVEERVAKEPDGGHDV